MLLLNNDYFKVYFITFAKLGYIFRLAKIFLDFFKNCQFYTRMIIRFYR